jgi:hypothetical protein
MVIEGSVQIGDQILEERDAMGISQTEQFSLDIKQNARILVIEVPMN